MRLRDAIGISTRTQARLSWAMEVALVGILLIGLYRGSQGVVVNTVVSLVVTQLPPLLERHFGIIRSSGNPSALLRPQNRPH